MNGNWVGTHFNPATNYRAFTDQWLSGLDDNATYTLTADVQSTGGNAAYIEVLSHTSAGTVVQQVNIPANSNWNTVTIPNIKPAWGGIQLNIISAGNAGDWFNFDNVKLVR